MFLLNVKRFIKSRVFLISTICYFVILYLIQPVHSVTTIYDIVNSSLTTQPFSFLYFLVISYEFFYQVRGCRLEELVFVSRMGQVHEKMYGILFFTGLDILLCVVYFVLSVISSVWKFGLVDKNWFLMLWQTIFIYHFLLYFSSILFGVLISLIRSRFRAFGVLMLIFSIFSNILLPTISYCVKDSERWTHILDIFGIMNRNYYSGCDFYYMYSVEAVNVQRILFWILFVGMLLCLILSEKKKWVLGGSVFLCACFMFYLYIQPAGYRYNGGWWGVGLNEQQYYSLLLENDKDGIAREYKEADFKMLKIQGNLEAKRVLRASLDVTVDKRELEEYCFTLYHGYGIRSITDEKGNTLSFEQDGDHVRINNNDSKMIQKIHFEYEGYSKTYVATSQAVFLVGNFPYLPQPGWKEYMSEPVEDNWDVEYNLKGIGYPVEYDIQTDTKYKVYSNLDEKENAHFVGTSEAATFMACPFIREMNIRGCTYYYSMLCVPYYPQNINETKKKIESTMDDIAGPEQWNGMKIFDLTNAGGFEFVYCFAKDHIVAGLGDMKSFYPYYLQEGEIPNIDEMMGGVDS